MAKSKYKKTVIKFQRPVYGSNLVLMYNEDHSIIGQLPMDEVFESLFGGSFKIYRECRYRKSDGYLEIGREVQANW